MLGLGLCCVRWRLRIFSTFDRVTYATLAGAVWALDPSFHFNHQVLSKRLLKKLSKREVRIIIIVMFRDDWYKTKKLGIQREIGYLWLA